MSERGRLHYAWLVVGVTFVVLLAGAGIRSVPGVLIIPLEREFGWSRAAVSLAVSINLFLYGLCGPFGSAVVERLGMRRVIVSALLLLAAAVGATTLMTQPWQGFAQQLPAPCNQKGGCWVGNTHRPACPITPPSAQ